jgi:hypothetical protein
MCQFYIRPDAVWDQADKTQPDNFTVAKHRFNYNHMQVKDTKFLYLTLLHGLSHQGGDRVGTSSQQPIIYSLREHRRPPQNVQVAHSPFQGQTFTFISSSQTPFPSPTPMALHPEPLYYTDSANEAWALLSSSSNSPYWYSYDPFQACHLFSINGYFIYFYSLCFIIAMSHFQLFLNCIPDPLSSAGGCRMVISSFII